MSGPAIARLDSLRDGDITWTEFINSLSPEDLERQREYDRRRLKKWYHENRDKRLEYIRKYNEDNKEKLQQKARERYAENRERLTASHICAVCGSSYTFNGKTSTSTLWSTRKLWANKRSKQRYRDNIDYYCIYTKTCHHHWVRVIVNGCPAWHLNKKQNIEQARMHEWENIIRNAKRSYSNVRGAMQRCLRLISDTMSGRARNAYKAKRIRSDLHHRMLD